MEPLWPPPDSRPAAPAAPSSLPQILDTAFDLLRRNGPLLVGLAALVYVPLAFATMAGLPGGSSGRPAAEPTSWALAALVLAVVALPIVFGGLTDTCGALLRGREVDAGQALRTGLVLALPLVATLFVVACAMVAALAPFGLVILWGDSLPTLLQVAATIGTLLLPIVLMLRLSLLSQVVVLERVFGPRALLRANRLIEGQVLRVFGILFLVSLLMGFLAAAAEFALRDLPGVGPAVTGLIQAVGFAYTTAVGVVLYADVRVRRNERGEWPAAADPPSRDRTVPPGV